jgi:membrane-associated phospholipid phosphatase
VLLAVHWFSDVLGGLALGWGWCALCVAALGQALFDRPHDGSAVGHEETPAAAV